LDDDSIREETLATLQLVEQTITGILEATAEEDHAMRAKLSFLLVSLRAVRTKFEPLWPYLQGRR
jgi:hypothetical protein